MGPGVVSLRILKIGLDTSATVVFVYGLSRWLSVICPRVRARRRTFVVLFPFVATANAFGYGMFGQTVSYNSLNADALMLCYGLFLPALAPHRRFTVYSVGAYMLAGMVAGVDFFVKFSSSVPLFCICAVAVTVVGGYTRYRDRFLSAASLAIGYLLGLALFFEFFLDARTWASHFRMNVSAQSLSSHNPSQLFSSMALSIGVFVALIVLQAVVSGMLFLLIARASRGAGCSVTARVGVGLLKLLVLFALTVIALQETLQPCLGGWGTVMGFGTIIASVCGLAAIRTHTTVADVPTLIARNRYVLSAMVLMLIAPFIGVLGSNVPLLSAAGSYMTFWSALIAVLLLHLPSTTWTARGLIPGLWAAPPLLVIALTVQGLILHPFGVPTSLFSQTELLATSGDLRGLRVDWQTAQFFRVTRRFVLEDAGFYPGSPIIAAYDLPGLVYVLGGVSPGAPWFFADEPQQQLNCVELRSSRLNKLRHAIVLVMPAMLPPFKMLLANLYAASGSVMRVAKGDRRVCANGMSASQAAVRTKLSAVAINRWSKRVFARPM